MPTLAEPKHAITPPARKMPIQTLRCMAYKQTNNLYVAECIDLDLMVKAKSMKQATDSLNEAIRGYLTVACEGDVKGLIPRPSPISRRAVYHWAGINSRLAHFFHWNTSKRNEPRRFSYTGCHA